MQDSRDGRPGLLDELKRRRVVRVGVTYAGAAFVLLQALQLVLGALMVSDQVFRALVLLALVGFPIALLLGWLFDLTPEGVRMTARGDAVGPLVARFRPRAVATAGGVVLVGGALLTVTVNLPRPAIAEVPAGADLIAVLPFTATGDGVEDLEHGMVDLLSRNLDQVGAIRTVDPRTVLHRWEQRAAEGPLSFEDALEVARESFAGSVLTGSIVAAGPEVRIFTELHSIDGSLLARVKVDGPAADILSLVDSLSLMLLHEVWRSERPVPRLDVGAITSGNLEAIRAFLAGERHYRASAWDSAMLAFSRAVAADSVFPLAHLRLAATAGWAGRNDVGQRSAATARRFADRLPAREQTLVRVEELRSSGRRAEAIDSLSLYVERFPDDPEGWFYLADDLYHLRGELRGPGRSDSDDPFWLFDKSLALDPSFAPALIHPLEIAFRRRDGERIDRYLGMLEGSSAADAEGIELYRAAAEALREPRDPSVLVAALSRAIREGGGEMDLSRQAAGAVYQPLLGEVVSWPPARRREVMEELRGEPRAAEHRPAALRAVLTLLFATGETAEGRAMLAEPEVRSALGEEAVRRFAVLPVLAGIAPESSLRGSGAVRLEAAHERAVALVSAIDRGDAGALRQAVDALRAGPAEDAAAREALVRAGNGFLTVLQGDTIRGLRDVESALESADFELDLVQALWFRWSERMAAHPGMRPRVLDGLARPWSGDPVYEGPRAFVLGRALEAEGRAEEARAAYAGFLEALSGADPDLPVQPKVREARAALGRLPAPSPGAG